MLVAVSPRRQAVLAMRAVVLPSALALCVSATAVVALPVVVKPASP